MKPFDHTSRLRGVDPELIACFILACHEWAKGSGDGSFVRVTEGLRSPDRQAKLVKQGLSQTLASYHLTGRAIDVALFPHGELTWDFDYYRDFADAMYNAAGDLDVLINWGGEWTTLRDGPHFQIEKL